MYCQNFTGDAGIVAPVSSEERLDQDCTVEEMS